MTATYVAGRDPATATAEASATTELFQPAVTVTKDCTPDPADVGVVVTCTIVVTNDELDDTPDLTNGTIVDTLTGNLLDPGNPAVDSSDCAADLPTGETLHDRHRPGRSQRTTTTHSSTR